MQLDRTDKRILHELQLDARISNQELADKVGLSPSPCLRRVRQLEEAGLIKGYATELDASKLGLKLMAIVQVAMDRHTPDRTSTDRHAPPAALAPRTSDAGLSPMA